MIFVLLVSVLFSTTPSLPYIGVRYLWGGGGGGVGGGVIKMASASTPSTIEPAKDVILLHTIQLKPRIKHKSQEEWYLVVY